MFETGVRQLRMALSMIWGRPFNTDSLTRLVADAVATVSEFGELHICVWYLHIKRRTAR